MSTPVDLVLEIFTWVGLGGAFALLVCTVVVWAVDGTWLSADAIVDREDGHTVVRWVDADGDVNSATPTAADAAELAGRDSAAIWYRHGWQGRMRLRRRPAGLRAILLSAAGLAALGILCLVTGWVLYFARG